MFTTQYSLAEALFPPGPSYSHSHSFFDSEGPEKGRL